MKMMHCIPQHEILCVKTAFESCSKTKIEIKLFIQSAFATGSRLMGTICIHLMIYFLECTNHQNQWKNDVILNGSLSKPYSQE